MKPGKIFQNELTVIVLGGGGVEYATANNRMREKMLCSYHQCHGTCNGIRHQPFQM